MVYNLTVLTGAGNEVGALLSVSILAGAALAIAANALMLTGRRKRGAEDPLGRGGAEAFQRHVVKMVSELDQFGCTAGALCEAASTSVAQRSTGQEVLLTVLGWSSADNSLSWHKMADNDSKYPYALQVGRNGGDCLKAFPRCPVPFSRVSEEFTGKLQTCSANQKVLELVEAASDGAEHQAQKHVQQKRVRREENGNDVFFSSLRDDVDEVFQELWGVKVAL